MPDKFLLIRQTAAPSVEYTLALLRGCCSVTPQASFFVAITAFLLLPGFATTSAQNQLSVADRFNDAEQTLDKRLLSNHSKPADTITLALNELDSPIFKNREKAIQQLVKLGEPAIEPLALKSLDCTPETAWRIRKILEEISIGGDEPVFLKSIAILQIRFRSGMKSAAMQESFARLEARWKSNRKKNGHPKPQRTRSNCS